MKTLQECKDEVARTIYMQPDWYTFRSDGLDWRVYEEAHDDVAELYASQFKASEPIEKELEALFDELLSKYMWLIRYESGSGWHAVQEIMKDFTITRKQTDNGDR
jgi:hypothetical protein